MFRPMRQGFRSPPPVGPGVVPGSFPGAVQAAGGGGTYPWGIPTNAGTPPYGIRQRPFAKSPQQQQGLSPFHQQHRYKSPSPGHQQPQSFTPRHRSHYSSPPYHPHSPGQASSQQPSPGSGHYRRYPGSPRSSTPFGGSGYILERKSPAPVELYYKASMLQDPWADLQPVSASDIDLQYSKPQAASAVKGGRYFS